MMIAVGQRFYWIEEDAEEWEVVVYGVYSDGIEWESLDDGGPHASGFLTFKTLKEFLENGTIRLHDPIENLLRLV